MASVHTTGSIVTGVPRPRKQSQAETRLRLLDAAHRAFSTQRFTDVSLDAVAEAAGFTKGAIYANFQSKTDLLFSVLERYLAEVGDDYTGLTAAGAAGELGAQIGERAGRTEADEIGYFRLLAAVWVEAMHDETFGQRFAAIRRAHRARIANAITERAAGLGVELPVSADDLATGIIGMSMAAFFDAAIDPDVSAVAVHETMISLIEAGVIASVSQP